MQNFCLVFRYHYRYPPQTVTCIYGEGDYQLEPGSYLITIASEIDYPLNFATCIELSASIDGIEDDYYWPNDKVYLRFCNPPDLNLQSSYSVCASVDVDEVAPGQTVDYDITITNTGETNYVLETNDPAGFLFDMSEILPYATYNGDASLPGASFIGTTLSWSGDLDVGQTLHLTFSVTVGDFDGVPLVGTVKTLTGYHGSCTGSCAETTTLLNRGPGGGDGEDDVDIPGVPSTGLIGKIFNPASTEQFGLGAVIVSLLGVSFLVGIKKYYRK